jgi:hypothetical protein
MTRIFDASGTLAACYNKNYIFKICSNFNVIKTITDSYKNCTLCNYAFFKHNTTALTIFWAVTPCSLKEEVY